MMMAVFGAGAKASGVAATVAMMLIAAPGHAQHRASNLGSVASHGCGRLNSAASLEDIDSVLESLEAVEFAMLRNAANEARANHQATIFAAVGLDDQIQRWSRDRDNKSRDLHASSSQGAVGRDSDPAIAIANADIARLQIARAERTTLANAAVAAINELVVRNATSPGDLLSGTTTDLATLEEKVFLAQTAIEEHVARTGLATIADIDQAIDRRTSERAALLSSYDGLRARALQDEIDILSNRMTNVGRQMNQMREEAESYRREAWSFGWTEQAIRNCAVLRGRALGASGAPPGAGRPPVAVQPPQVTTVPQVVAPQGAPARTMPRVTRFSTHGHYASQANPNQYAVSVEMQIELTYYENGSITGTMSYGSTVVGSLSGQWPGARLHGRLSVVDGLLRPPGSGGGGSWRIDIGSGLPSGAWCITSSAPGGQVARQFGMIYAPGNNTPVRQFDIDPLCLKE